MNRGEIGRIKHWAGFPSEAIRYCLREASVKLSDVSHVAVNQDGRANLPQKLGYVVTRRPDLGLILDRVRNKQKRAGVGVELEACFPGERFAGGVHEVEHHLAHLASAFLVSPFEEAVTVSVDGFGDFASAGWGGRGSTVEVEDRVYCPHSLGIFYRALTQFLGFPNYGDEYKVMGLAPYGEPVFLPQMRKIVRLRDGGGFQGRMEWGPRALGNRSIVCDPRRADMKEILNSKIKRRESFRPFAPSILREAVPEWFETDDDVPFMMQVYPIRPEKRALIPAVTHVDGTGRLQTVTRESNARYYRLIEAFCARTGVPMVLNTSFNENEPVVCKPEEALDCFLRTKMDVLVMGGWFISR